MQQVAECQWIEQKRILGFAGLGPSETVSPEIAQRIAEQFGERSRRLLTLKGRDHDGMITADKPVIGSQLPSVPVDPARDCGYCRRQIVEFGQAGEQPVGPSCCMFGYARALSMKFRWVRRIE